MANVPTFHTITLTSASTEYNLYTLLSAIESTLPKRCLFLQLQFDSAAGGDYLHIGNVGGEATDDAGVELLASQAFSIQSTQSNLIMMTNIALWSNGASHKVRVAIVTR